MCVYIYVCVCDSSLGDLQIWEAEPVKNLGVLELSTRQLVDKGGPEIGTQSFLDERVGGLSTGITSDGALDQRETSFGENSCEITVDLPLDEVLITRVKNKILDLWPGVSIHRQQSRAFVGKAPRATLVFTPVQDATLGPYTLTLARWAWEKEVGVIVGTRFILDSPEMRFIEVYSPWDLTLWAHFYLRAIQLSSTLTNEQKKVMVLLLTPLRVDVWGGNFESLFGSTEQMARHFANFDATEHHKPKELQDGKKGAQKQREQPGVVHALYDRRAHRIYQGNKGRSVSGMLFLPKPTSSSAAGSSSGQSGSGNSGTPATGAAAPAPTIEDLIGDISFFRVFQITLVMMKPPK